MKILRSQLNSNDTAVPVREAKGQVNCVLAVWADSRYDRDNTYIPKWQVVNAVYYNAHKDEFEGWIDLEDAFPPEEFL